MPIAESCVINKDARIPYPELVNLYGCRLKRNVFVGPFVEIQSDVSVDENSRVQSHTFICSGVSIGKNVFIGHGVIFINDRHPKVNKKNWVPERTIVEDDVSIGSGAIIMGGLRIGKGAVIGAGSVVTKDVEARKIVIGVPARCIESGDRE